MKKIIALILSLCMVLALLAGCTDGDSNSTDSGDASGSAQTASTDSSPSATQNAEKSGLVIRDEYLAEKVTIGVSGDGSSLAPWGRAVFGQAEARNIVVQKLLRADTDGNIYYELAKSVEEIDDLQYKITLWDNITDSAGNPFTSDDVVFSMEKYLETGNQGAVNKFDHFEIIDDYTLIWHCKRAFAIGEFARQFSNANMVTQEAYEASSDDMSVNLVGTGAYKIKSYTPGSELVLEANEDFWMKDLPEDVREGLWYYNYQNVGEIVYTVITDASQRAIALEMGTVDAIDSILDVDLKAFESNSDITPVQMLQRPPVPVLFNCSDTSPCSDINLRMAICTAINNAEVAAGVGDFAFPVYAFEPNQIDSPTEWMEGREYYDYSETEAKKLLEDSGYNGETLTLMYVGTSTGVSYEEVAIVVKAQLAKIGISVELKMVDQSVNEVDRFVDEAWDLRMDQFGGGDYYVNVMKSFTSEGYETDLQGKNLMLVEDAKLDELFKTMESDPSAANIEAFDDYFTYEMCYGYGIIGYYLRTAQRSNVQAALGDRGTYLVPNAFTFNA